MQHSLNNKMSIYMLKLDALGDRLKCVYFSFSIFNFVQNANVCVNWSDFFRLTLYKNKTKNKVYTYLLDAKKRYEITKGWKTSRTTRHFCAVNYFIAKSFVIELMLIFNIMIFQFVHTVQDFSAVVACGTEMAAVGGKAVKKLTSKSLWRDKSQSNA